VSATEGMAVSFSKARRVGETSIGSGRQRKFSRVSSDSLTKLALRESVPSLLTAWLRTSRSNHYAHICSDKGGRNGEENNSGLRPEWPRDS
jgi:hypothetical protein